MNELVKYISNIPGWRTKRRLIIIESDDWGSLRAPSKRGFEMMKKQRLPLGNSDSIRFNKYDDLADANDLEMLFEILSSVKDINGNTAIFTPFCLVANPDFEKIKKDDFQTYYYESFLTTLKKQNKTRAWNLWKEGARHNTFVPEFHGREHLNVALWMRDLRGGNKITVEGFKYNFWGFRPEKSQLNYQAAFDLQNRKDIHYQKETLIDGLKLFESIHGKKAKCFVPPNGPFSNQLEPVTAEFGIDFISTSKFHKEPLGNKQIRRRFRYLGKTNKSGQQYLTRNAFFEPSNPKKSDWLNSCLNEIQYAFNLNKPATISTHRVNYIGCHSEKNRDKSLKQLKFLLDKIVMTWPDVEFVSSSDLGRILRRQ